MGAVQEHGHGAASGVRFLEAGFDFQEGDVQPTQGRSLGEQVDRRRIVGTNQAVAEVTQFGV